jgi:hypothetical protein
LIQTQQLLTVKNEPTVTYIDLKLGRELKETMKSAIDYTWARRRTPTPRGSLCHASQDVSLVAPRMTLMSKKKKFSVARTERVEQS